MSKSIEVPFLTHSVVSSLVSAFVRIKRHAFTFRSRDANVMYVRNIAIDYLCFLLSTMHIIIIQQLVKVDVAVACTSRRHAALSCVRRFADARPRFNAYTRNKFARFLLLQSNWTLLIKPCMPAHRRHF